MTVDFRKTQYSIADYLAAERAARDKHEYRDGEILLMAGGSADHSLVCANVIGELRNLLKGKPCLVYDSNLRIRIPRTILYTYPEATIICGPRITDPNDTNGETITNPKVIIEVLSPTTEAYDRGDKFGRYRLLESLDEYILISLTTPRVESYYRAPAAQSNTPSDQRTWLISTTNGTDASAQLHAMGILLPLTEIYRGITFPAPQPEP